MVTKLPMLLFVFMISSVNIVLGQSGIEMADIMRSNGKIYVVVAVAATVMLGILIYLALLDRKITALEKKIKGKA
ncbi:MAG: CcmD family protein [Bacteroidota bacterium]|nr:CcmD family protein [Bacteroidota bacterium]